MSKRSYRIAYRYWKAWARLEAMLEMFRYVDHPPDLWRASRGTQPPVWRQRRLRRQHLGRRRVNITQGWG